MTVKLRRFYAVGYDKNRYAPISELINKPPPPPQNVPLIFSYTLEICCDAGLAGLGPELSQLLHSCVAFGYGVFTAALGGFCGTAEAELRLQHLMIY